MIDFTDKNISLEKRKNELMRMILEMYREDKCDYEWNDLVSMCQLIESMDFEEDFQALFNLIALSYTDGYLCGCYDTEDNFKKNNF